MYPSKLNVVSQLHSRNSDFRMPTSLYDAVQANVVESCYYTFFSKSIIDTYGYLNENSFSPKDPYLKWHLHNNDDFDDEQFKLYDNLQFNTK